MRPQPIGNGLLMARASGKVAAVIAALQLQGPNFDNLISLDDAGWQEALTVCDRLQVTLYLALRSCEGFPVWVRERLTSNLADAARRFVRVKATYCEAAAALDEAGIPHLVLKGFTQSPDFVKAPQFRMQGDIDFYTSQEHTRAAVDALGAIGYEPAGTPEDYLNADHPPTLTRFGGWKWRGDLFDPEMPLALEVHKCLWNSDVWLISLPEVEEFWKRRIDRRLDTLTFCSLDPVDHLSYFAMHLLRDAFLCGRVIHHAQELASFLHQRVDDAAFWREWEARYSQRLKQMQAIAFALASAGFSSRVPEMVEEHIELLPREQRAWIETCGGSIFAETFRRSRDGRLLQFLLSDSTGAQRRILWKALAPGVIPSPTRLANQPKVPGAPQILRRRQPWRYPAYLASRILLNGAAVLRFVANGLTILLSNLGGRREARSQ